MNVCVQGLWHLGTITAAGLASLGHHVVGLDYSSATVGELAQGVPPLAEPGLEALLQRELFAGSLGFTAAAELAVRDIELLWVTYDTPVDEDDHADVDFVIGQIERTLPYLASGVTILISSQLPVGTVRRLESLVASRFPGREFGFACSPENLRLGSALEQFLNPDRIVVGVRSVRDRERITRLLQPLSARIEWMSVESAEMTKHAINAFLALSVTFANEIAAICEHVGADAKEVERGLKTEARIGPKAYLASGGAFAGGTLARDVTFLNRIGTLGQLDNPLLAAITVSNDGHKQWVRRKLQVFYPDLKQLRVAVWGLSYKPGVDTLRRSLAVEFCDWLIVAGARVHVYDPGVKSLPTVWQDSVLKFDDAMESLKDCQALVLFTSGPHVKDISAADIAAVAPGILIIDPDRFLANLSGDCRLRYVTVGAPLTELSDECIAER